MNKWASFTEQNKIRCLKSNIILSKNYSVVRLSKSALSKKVSGQVFNRINKSCPYMDKGIFNTDYHLLYTIPIAKAILDG